MSEPTVLFNCAINSISSCFQPVVRIWVLPFGLGCIVALRTACRMMEQVQCRDPLTGNPLSSVFV